MPIRIVIEVEGQKITAIDAETVPGSPQATIGNMPPGPPPEDLLKRAKKLGAKNAGAAQFGTGATLMSTSKSSEGPRQKSGTGSKPASKKRRG